SPASGATFRVATPITLTASASDSDGIKLIAYYSTGGNWLATGATNPPYTASWSPPSAGNWGIVARATDNRGITADSAPVAITITPNALPTVSLTAPADGTSVSVGSAVTVSATASDSDGTVLQVDFL